VADEVVPLKGKVSRVELKPDKKLAVLTIEVDENTYRATVADRPYQEGDEIHVYVTDGGKRVLGVS
jgi:hypothetical protein